MKKNNAGVWCRWTPASAREDAYEDVAKAVKEFEPLDTEGGLAAAAWQKTESLANHPSTVTYLLMDEGQVEGFFAICSSSVELTTSHQKQIVRESTGRALTPTQGASLLAWMARHRDSNCAGIDLLAYALHIALEVACLQGTVAFVLDPYDAKTADVWQRRYRFRRSRTKTRADVTRLWLPLHPL